MALEILDLDLHERSSDSDSRPDGDIFKSDCELHQIPVDETVFGVDLFDDERCIVFGSDIL